MQDEACCHLCWAWELGTRLRCKLRLTITCRRILEETPAEYSDLGRVGISVLARLMERDRFGTRLGQASQVEGEHNKRTTSASIPREKSYHSRPSGPHSKVSSFNSSWYDPCASETAASMLKFGTSEFVHEPFKYGLLVSHCCLSFLDVIPAGL